MPLSRLVALAARDGGIELLGGLANGDHSSDAVRHVTLRSGRVAAAGRLAVGVHDSAGAAVGGRFLLYGGGAGTEVATVQRIVPGGTAIRAGSLPAPRSDLVAVQSGSTVVLVGGYDGTHTLADVLVSRAGGRFTVLSRLVVPVRYPSALVRGHDVLVYGGDVNRKPVDVIQRIDLSTGITTVVGHLPLALSHESALLLGGSAWLAGGSTANGTTAAVLRSVDGVHFLRSGHLPGPRSDAGAVVVDGVGFLIGGETPSRTATVVALRPVR